jgi:hypothetical protein
VKFIVAQNYQRYYWWCREQNPPLNPRGPEVKYVKDINTLRGVAVGFDYLCIGDWTSRPDWRDIHHVLLTRGKRPK